MKCLLATLLCLAGGPCIFAQTVPALINYQGRLAKPDGSSLPTADYELSFSIWNAPTNGTRVWGPQMFDDGSGAGHGAKVPVVQGYFNIILGPADTNGASIGDAFTNAICHIEVAVSTNPPIAPRQQILTTPFAFNSARLGGHDWSAVFGTNDPVNGRIPTAKLDPNGTLVAAKFSGSGLGLTGLSGSNFVARVPGTNVPIGGLAQSLPVIEQRLEGASSTTFQDIPNLTVTIQTTGRPVMAFLTSSYTNNMSDPPAATSGYTGLTYNESPIGAVGHFRLVRNNGQAAILTNFGDGSGSSVSYRTPHPVCMFLDTPPAGTNSYTLQWGFESNPQGGSARLGYSVLTVFEL